MENNEHLSKKIIEDLFYLELIKNSSIYKAMEIFEPGKIFIYKVNTLNQKRKTKKDFFCIGCITESYLIGVEKNKSSKIFLIDVENEAVVTSFVSFRELFISSHFLSCLI